MSYPFTTIEFRAQCLRVIDGDSYYLYVDGGFHSYRQERFRLIGVDTPELRSKDEPERQRAQEAKVFVEGILKPTPLPAPGGAWPLRIVTFKDPDNFGRYLAEVYYKDDDGVEHNLGDELLAKGLAKPYEG